MGLDRLQRGKPTGSYQESSTIIVRQDIMSASPVAPVAFSIHRPHFAIQQTQEKIMSQMDSSPEINMDPGALSREEVFTDSRVGTIRKMTPVTIEGEVDSSRPLQFVGSTQIMTPGGALPLSFEIKADTLEDAVAGFGEAAKLEVERTMEELKEMQRQQASSIVVPGRDNNKIQIP